VDTSHNINIESGCIRFLLSGSHFLVVVCSPYCFEMKCGSLEKPCRAAAWCVCDINYRTGIIRPNLYADPPHLLLFGSVHSSKSISACGVVLRLRLVTTLWKCLRLVHDDGIPNEEN